MKVYIIDAFTDKVFNGNPAGVCLPDEEVDSGMMQSIAGKLNLSETAFVMRHGANPSNFSIRYFTPAVEIDFCGHATLAAAKLFLHLFGNPAVSFITGKGLLLEAWGEGELIKMKFPLYEPKEHRVDKTLYEAFGISSPIATKFAEELGMLLIEVKDKETLLQLQPDFSEALRLSDSLKEVVVTARSSDSKYDFYSRCFCPWIGINEDPVTGAAHSILASYWGKILEKKEMSAYQCSKRGGSMQLKIRSATELEIGSNAKIVFEGTLFPDS